MVSTRSKGAASAETGDKRPASTRESKRDGPSKKVKTGKSKGGENDTLQVGKDGQVELKGKQEGDQDLKEKQDGESKSVKDEEQTGAKTEVQDEHGGRGDGSDKEEDVTKGGESKKPGEGPIETEIKAGSPGATEEPKHGTLESGHIYFLYRPKIDVEEVEGIDDVSKFHILLIPKTGPHGSSHYHRVIEVGKKKLPDPGAKRQVIWGLVGSVSTDKTGLKDAFGEYSYETKTKGTRTQPAARPAARGHYILHSPRDELADSPDHNRQRDFKTLLAYEITTPSSDDFGRVQEELGLEPKGAVALSVKDPDAASNNNPRAANMPREKKAHYPAHLHSLFANRRWIAPNPPAFLDYPGSELLILSSPHELHDSLGKDGEKVEDDMDQAARAEATDVEGALKELGMSKGDTEVEALEGAWA